MPENSQFPFFSACKSIKSVKKYGRYWFEIDLRPDVKCDWQSADFQGIHSCSTILPVNLLNDFYVKWDKNAQHAGKISFLPLRQHSLGETILLSRTTSRFFWYLSND
jgi:hypothetical protein